MSRDYGYDRHRDPAHPRPGPSRRGDPGGGIPDGLLMGVLILLLGITVLTWTATGLAGLIAHGSWPDGVSFTRTPIAVRDLAIEPRDLAGAWPDVKPSRLSGYGLFWGLFISQLMVAGVLSVFAVGTVTRARAVRAARRSDRSPSADPEPQKETRKEPQAESPSPDAPLETPRESQPEEAAAPSASMSKESAPSTQPARTSTPSADPSLAQMNVPHPVSVPATASPATDPHTRVLEAPGAVLVATSDPALWAATKSARAKLGPVHLFDPSQLCDTPDRLRWSPHHGCAEKPTAVARASALLAPLRSPRPIDAEVHSTAETLLRCWLHAAALDDRPFREVHRWALAKSAPSNPVQTLRTHPKASSGSAGELEAALTSHPERRRDATELIRKALAPLSQLHVRNACTAARADRIALDSFIDETGTLYVVGEDPELMPLLCALTASVIERGHHTAVRTSPSQLDPPLTTVLELPLDTQFFPATGSPPKR